MGKSFALIVDPSNNYDTLIKETSSFFGFTFRKVSPVNVTAIHNTKKFILELTPSKMHFMFPEKINNENIEDVLNLTREFMDKNFRKQTVGIRYYDDLHQTSHLKNIENVRTITL
jgi:hypothetical protein